ncbi:Ldh family oxidoreductase [Jiangella alkaliphila]|uniref:Malate/L-lactate dehydrogenase n=1 Tax=Jiangella alkaliphila TaxID=419479 RepID=A0A1H2FZJ5_9ACTN|nr:Ldh family oxidoreductase [Jiangella alkaliphila]SDU12755.1 Malate/L-lactate dehydrogenase [Jiangella alkaliphila]
MSDQPRLYRPADLTAFTTAVLRAAGCSATEAARVASCLVEADARGLPSHGLLRLPLYVSSVDAGGIVPDAPMTWAHEHGATATLDAGFGFGHTAIELAIERAGELAGRYGCAVVGVRRSTHFGMAAPWVERLAARGIVTFVLSNTGPSMAPYGSAEPLLGTNPISIGFPVDGRPPVVLDMATSAGAFGRIVAAAKNGDDIPAGWALDAAGAPTTDPEAALKGVLLPFGEHKGSGLAIAIELLAAALPGALLSHQITDIWVDPGSRMGTGHLVIAIQPGSLTGTGVYTERAVELTDRVASSTLAAGHPAVRLPGDVERHQSEAAHAGGVALAESTTEDLDRLAIRFALTHIQPIGTTDTSHRNGAKE